MRRLLWLGGIVLVGCHGAGERCPAIARQSVANTLYETTEKRIEAALYYHKDYPAKFAHDSAVVRMRREVRAQITGDSVRPAPVPPPKPSEIEWYAENCYEGKPR